MKSYCAFYSIKSQNPSPYDIFRQHIYVITYRGLAIIQTSFLTLIVSFHDSNAEPLTPANYLIFFLFFSPTEFALSNLNTNYYLAAFILVNRRTSLLHKLYIHCTAHNEKRC